MKIYQLDEDQLAALQKIADRLHGGTDRERDEGHRLWLIINQIKNQMVGEI